MASYTSMGPPGGPVGRRLLPQAIDDLAQREPEKAWARLPRGDVKGWQDISYSTLANGINQMARFIDEQFNLSPDGTFPTVCYIGKPDARYAMIEVAAAKTRCKVLFSSHINSLAAHLNLLAKTDCVALMTTSGVAVDDILQARPMQHYIVPELDSLLAAQHVEPFPFTKTFEEARDDPFLTLHTSGTTGLPKPVTYTHGAVAAQDAQSLVEPFTPEEAERRGWQRQRWTDVFAGTFTSPFAPFHVIMSIPTMVLTVFGQSTFVFPSREGLAHIPELMAAAKVCDTVWGSVATWEEVARNDEWLESLSRFDHVMSTAGTLSASAGAKLSAKTRIVNVFGTTEIGGALLVGVTEPEDFGAVLFDPDLNGMEWRPQGVDDDGSQLYEMVLVKKPELQDMQSVFQTVTIREKNEHSMGDLWVKHQTKPHAWVYRGRADDLICFANGLKYNATGTQNRLRDHPMISEAILLGDRREQTVLLLELSHKGLNLMEAGKEDAVRDSLWALVDSMNQELPSVARIARTHIILVPREKAFLRSPKGSIRRSATIDMFQAEIDNCYRTFGDEGPNMLKRVE